MNQPVIGALLQLLTDTADVGAALGLLGEDVHHHLAVQVCVLPVTHHLLQGRSYNTRAGN